MVITNNKLSPCSSSPVLLANAEGIGRGEWCWGIEVVLTNPGLSVNLFMGAQAFAWAARGFSFIGFCRNEAKAPLLFDNTRIHGEMSACKLRKTVLHQPSIKLLNYFHVGDFTGCFGFWKWLGQSSVLFWTEEVQIPSLLLIILDKACSS